MTIKKALSFDQKPNKKYFYLVSIALLVLFFVAFKTTFNSNLNLAHAKIVNDIDDSMLQSYLIQMKEDITKEEKDQLIGRLSKAGGILTNTFDFIQTLVVKFPANAVSITTVSELSPFIVNVELDGEVRTQKSSYKGLNQQ